MIIEPKNRPRSNMYSSPPINLCDGVNNFEEFNIRMGYGTRRERKREQKAGRAV